MDDPSMTADPAELAATLLTRTPGWARVGLTAPDSRLREAAASELAHTIVAALRSSAKTLDARQLALPL